MKKFGLLFSVLIVLSLVLAACSGGANGNANDLGEGTPAPGVGSEAMETPGADGLPGTGGTAVVTEDALATEAVATEAVITETLPTAGADALVTPMATAAQGEVAAGAMNDIARVSRLLGMDVQNMEGEQVGELEDLLLDLNGAQVSYALVGVGGFLDLGEKFVPVPFNALAPSVEGEDEVAMLLNVDREVLDGAPNLDRADVDFADPDWDVDFNTYWDGQNLPDVDVDVDTNAAGNGLANCELPSAAAGAGDVAATAVVTASGSLTGTNAAGTMQSGCLFSARDLLDYNVVFGDKVAMVDGAGAVAVTPAVTTTAGITGSAGSTAVMAGDVAGEIEDVIIDPQTGQIRYLVVDVDDILGLDDRWVLVPLRALQRGMGENSLELNVDQDVLINAPNFDVDVLPDLTAPDWDLDLDTYWDAEVVQ